MRNIDELKEIFATIFEEKMENINDEFSPETTDKWDSVNQMSLVTAMENKFDILIDIDDIYEMTSFATVVEVLKKYGVEFK
jgi:acyl carrier protein